VPTKGVCTTTSVTTLRVECPRAFKPLLSPARYKGAYGGRGGAKSHFFAERLVLRCLERPTRWACIREVQNSLKESVQQLLLDKVSKFGLDRSFKPVEGELRGPNNSLVIFKGMHHYNSETIKSLEGYDGAWVEEAQTFSERSLRMLRPTIRKEESELWFSWNPRHDNDPVDDFLRGPKKPPGAVVIAVSWKDNPWFPEVLHDEMRHDYATDPDMAAHVWGGSYEIISEGAYYAKLLAQAESDGRVGHFEYDPKYPVDTAWDLGVDDYNAVWLIQNDGVKAWAIGYDETSGEGPETIIPRALPKEYKYGRHFFPHDIRNRDWGAGARSRLEIVRGLGLTNVGVGIANGPEDRIAATRKLLPLMAFDSKCALGVKRLRNYRRKFNESLGVYSGPLHDEASHGSDAMGEYAINCQIIRKAAPVKSSNPPDLDRWRSKPQGTSAWVA
jgi:phage terminase large subunit